MFEDFDKQFKKLDQQPIMPLASRLAAYRDALVEKGFDREQTFALVLSYSKVVCEWILEEAISEGIAADLLGDPDQDDD